MSFGTRWCMIEKRNEVFAIDTTIYVNMFGKFTINGPGLPGPRVVGLSTRSRRLWMLVAYLILNRQRGVPAQELIDWIWPQAEGTNLTSTLQNNMSRTRNALGELGLENGRRLIFNNSGVYYWAPDRTTVLDCESFENLCTRALNGASVAVGMAAAHIYTGPFLPECQGEPWRDELHRHYEDLYRQLLTGLVPKLLERGELEEAEALCKTAQTCDAQNQLWPAYRMEALRRSAKPHEALRVFEELNLDAGALSAELALERAEALRECGEAGDESRLINDWTAATGPETGAMRCEKTVFRGFIRRQMRELRRGGEAQVLFLRTQSENGQILSQAMDRMEEVLTHCLRGSDPFTRGGEGLLLVLLSNANRENGDMVADRLIARYNKFCPKTFPPFTCQVVDLNNLSATSL